MVQGEGAEEILCPLAWLGQHEEGPDSAVSSTESSQKGIQGTCPTHGGYQGDG